MPKLIWDNVGEKKFEAGIDHGVLYPQESNGTYPEGVVWNGLTSVSETPEGGDPNDFYADNIKYGTLRGTENFNGSIEAYMFPDEFYEMDGSAEIATGIRVSGQSRKTFGLCYRSLIGNDVSGLDLGYKIHLVYGASVSPSDQSHETINDSPEPGTMSWEFTTVPVPVTGMTPTAHLVIDSTKVDSTALTTLEEVLYGSDTTYVYFPTSDETKQTGKTYYTKSGDTYSEFTGSEFAPGTTYYERTTAGPRLPLPDEILEMIA